MKKLLFYLLLVSVSAEIEISSLKSWSEIRNILENKTKSEEEALKVEYDVKSIYNKTLSIISSRKLPYMSIEMIRGGKFLILSGYYGDIWKTLEHSLHFRSSVFVKKMSNERTSLLNYDDMDLALSPVVLKPNDVEHFDYVMPLAQTWYNLFKMIDTDMANSYFYLSVWPRHLWFAIFAMILLLTFTFWATNRLKKERMELLDCFIHILGAIVNQGIKTKTDSFSVKIIIILSVIFGLFMTTLYSAILMSKLTTEGTLLSSFTIGDLLKTEKYSFCVSLTGLGIDFLRKNNSSRIHRRWSPIINRHPCTVGKKDIVPSNNYCKKDTIVFESLQNTFYNWKHSPGPCRVYVNPTRHKKSQITILFQKNFKYRKIIDKQLTKMRSSGILSKLKQQWLPTTLERYFTEKNYAYEITFYHVRQIFMVYIIIIFITIFILCIEMLTYKHLCKNRIKFGTLIVTKKV